MRAGGRALASVALLACGCIVLAVSARAQNAHVNEPRLERLDPQTRSAVLSILDSAHAWQLPMEPLVDRALEGQGKGIEGPRIVMAVRQLANDLRLARGALGANARDDEISAGANALHAGLTGADLVRLRAAASRCGRERVTLPLAMAADLVARAVPAPTAAALMIQLTGSGVRDPDLSTFQRNVRLDIERGADPATAARTRARGAALRAQPIGPRASVPQ